MNTEKKEEKTDGDRLKCKYCCFYRNKDGCIYGVPFCLLRGFGIYDEEQSCSKFVEMKE